MTLPAPPPAHPRPPGERRGGPSRESAGHGTNPLDLLKVVTWRVPRVDAAHLEGVTLRDGEAQAFLAALQRDLDATELVHFPTCQRVLVALTTPLPAEDVERRVSSAFAARAPDNAVPAPETLAGFDAFAHLSEVASSLDSLVPGEPQVLGQMKDAFERATRDGFVGRGGRGLTHVFPLAFRTAKSVRTKTALFKGKVSLVPLTLDAVASHLAGAALPKAAVVGTGTMGQRMAELVAETVPGTDVVRVSRDAARGEPLAAFLERAPALDLVAFATRADRPIFTPAHAAAFQRAKPGRDLLLIDLSLPRAVDPACAAVPGVRLLALDELTALSSRAKAERQGELDRARDVLKVELARVEAEYAALPAQRALAEYRKDVEAVAEERFARGAQRFPEAFDDPEFRKWFDQTIRAVAHVAQERLTRDATRRGPREPRAGEAEDAE